MKLHVNTNIDLDLSELAEFFIEPTINKTKTKLKAKLNPYFNEMWGDFDQIRSMSPYNDYDARCYITSQTFLVNAGIDRHHIGLYDLTDNDNIFDFYAGIPEKLDRRAKLNGFKTNVAWLVVHELTHGLGQYFGLLDSVHEMEAQGRLKELYFMLYNELLKTKISLWQRIIQLIKIKLSYGNS